MCTRLTRLDILLLHCYFLSLSLSFTTLLSVSVIAMLSLISAPSSSFPTFAFFFFFSSLPHTYPILFPKGWCLPGGLFRLNWFSWMLMYSVLCPYLFTSSWLKSSVTLCLIYSCCSYIPLLVVFIPLDWFLFNSQQYSQEPNINISGFLMRNVWTERSDQLGFISTSNGLLRSLNCMNKWVQLHSNNNFVSVRKDQYSTTLNSMDLIFSKFKDLQKRNEWLTFPIDD